MTRTWLLFLATSLYIFSVLALCLPRACGVAHGQAPDQAARDALALARVTVSEASFTDGDDIAGIYAVLLRRSRRSGSTIERAARIQSPRPFARRRCAPDRPHSRADPCRSRRRWIAYLRGDTQRPRGWPRSMPWPARRWADMLARARRLVTGEERPPCMGVYQWGGPEIPADAARIRRLTREGRWHPVNCGRTENVFLAPGRAP